MQRPKQVPELGEGARNSAARGSVTIRFETSDHRTAVLGSDPSVGSEVTWRESTLSLKDAQVLVIPSRRTLLNQLFQNLATERTSYVTALASATRGQPLQSIGGRLVRMNQNRPEIDRILTRVLGRPLHWILEPSQTSGQVRLRFFASTGPHLGDSLADGLAALLFLADALYDSRPGDLIVLDEPELSLHPTAQRRLAKLLAEYAADRQIVCATHSPEFADWSFLLSGAQLVVVGEEVVH